MIRGAPLPVAELVEPGRARELRGIGPGSRPGCVSRRYRRDCRARRARARASAGTHRSRPLSRAGASARSRSRERSTSIRPRSFVRRWPPAACGPCRVSGRRPRRGSARRSPASRTAAASGTLLNRAWELVGGIATKLEGEAAGDVRRGATPARRLTVVCAAAERGFGPRALRRAAAGRRAGRAGRSTSAGGHGRGRAVGRRRRAAHLGTALVRATGSEAYVEALEPLPEAPDEAVVYRALELPWCPPASASSRSAASRRRWSSWSIRGDLHCHTTWSDGRASVEEMAARAARERGDQYLAICDHICRRCRSRTDP